MSPPGTPGAARKYAVLASGIALDMATIVLATLLGVAGPAMVERNGQPHWLVGVAVASFFVGGSAAAKTLGGRLESLGTRRVALAGGSASAVALGAVAVGGGVPAVLLGSAALAGAAFGLTMPSTNAAVHAAAPERQLVVMLSIKQTAVPLGMMAAAYGGSVPSTPGSGTPFGFAAAFAVLAVFAGALVLPRRAAASSADGAPASVRAAERPGPALGILGVVTMLVSLVPGALTGYAYTDLLLAGYDSSGAARLLVLANIAGMGSRLVSGLVVHRYPRITDSLLRAMILGGVLGALLLGLNDHTAATAGVMIAFTFGWGWSALMFAIAIDRSEGRPALAGAVIQSGGMLGNASGPLLLALSSTTRYQASGWFAVALLAFAGGSILAVGNKGLRFRKGSQP